ncbi:MAG TPA: hypothetical protein VMQ52_04265 [Candidatus Saccharimonadales bacterium]|jgi:hypothetical protein|nr:hypothetical protein [Candidatus Saccharimonadales bacterium]
MTQNEQAPLPDYLGDLNRTFGDGAAKIIERLADDNPLSSEDDVRRWAWELIPKVEALEMPLDQEGLTSIALQMHEYRIRYVEPEES